MSATQELEIKNKERECGKENMERARIGEERRKDREKNEEN